VASGIKDFSKLQWYYQVLAVAAFCGLMLGLVWYQYLSPIQVSIEGKRTELDVVKAQVLKSQAEERAFAKFKAESSALQEQLDRLKSVLPLEKETDQILRQVQSSASSSALRIIRVVSKATIDHDVYTEWPIEMEIVGTFHNLGRYLDKIRLLPRIVNVSNMKIQSRATEGPGGTLATVGATYTATTFVYKEEAAGENAPKVTVTK
jgi:type IV pilus assembly protein PilO